MRITWHADDRYDTGVAAVEGGFVSADATTLTRWRIDGDTASTVDELTTPSPLPGPLTVAADGTAIGWGPTLVRDGTIAWATEDLVAAALADLGSGAIRWFRLEAGTVDPDGTRVALVLRGVRPRTVRDRMPATPGIDARLAILRTGAVERQEDGRAPTCLGWVGDELLAGDGGAIHILGEQPDSDGRLDLPERTSAASVLAVSEDGRIAAGLDGGGLVVYGGRGGPPIAAWDAHSAPVTALSWSGDRLASAGSDGTVLMWIDGAAHGRLDVDDPVDSLAWVDDDRVVAKIGGSGGRLILVSS